MAVYRHRPQTMAALEKMVDAYAEEPARRRSGRVGEATAASSGRRFIREVRIGDGRRPSTAASILENGDGLRRRARRGGRQGLRPDRRGRRPVIDNGSIVERCFVGESCRLDKGFTAAESLFFANSHCENGEAASIFAGPYTVSHHKSSLLIAGMFSFFNAGSGSNQSNHLFKSGAVHQSVHLRGCKFASSAYIMSPSAGRAPSRWSWGTTRSTTTRRPSPTPTWSRRRGARCSCPGANLTSFGAVRDIEKWPARDRRSVIRRDVISFDEYNPLHHRGAMLQGRGHHSTRSQEEDPDAPAFTSTRRR